jgi:hypothetical protein
VLGDDDQDFEVVIYALAPHSSGPSARHVQKVQGGGVRPIATPRVRPRVRLEREQTSNARMPHVQYRSGG